MKNVIVTFVMLFGLITFAQEKQVQKADRKAKMENRESLSPDQQAELQVKKMTLNLDLNANQQAEVKKILLNQAKKREAKKAEWKANKEAGKSLSKDEKFAMKNQMLDEQIAMKAEMKKILTADQFAKWEAKQAERKDKMQDRRESKGKKLKERK
ncbi:MAG TPA: hypothetical protein PLL09_14915 [Flavobacterium sp.]|uniref:DUF4890 domain-containing protein n=1 Tax=unclassified Flavobacterium TaxID=196869 RepID=UPI0025C618C9|nr:MULTISPECIES: hypothetical protein [unclassified Flavobacterium]HRE79105.1 hypothetical protein [Flavobacterium sp.]